MGLTINRLQRLWSRDSNKAGAWFAHSGKAGARCVEGANQVNLDNRAKSIGRHF